MKSRAIEILVLDDDPDTVEVLGDLLGEAGYRVAAESSPAAAIERLGAQTFHVLILDLRLPGVDGLEVLEKIRERDRDLAVIVLSGAPSVESAVATLKVGVSDYVAKPIEPRKLLDAVAAAIESKGLLRDPEGGLLRSVGARVRARRKAQALTLKQVARRTGLSVSLLSQIERAESAASVASLYKIASALGTSLEQLFEGF